MEGAGFAFETADMDFNNVFATMPQQQQSFAKPTEDNTFGFFGDEGIDTAASFIDPTVFSTPSQDMSFMPQTLAMDNTMSNAMWNSHLTPESLIMNSFPATPTQSLEMYPTNIGTSLGKRPRQLDVEDFTQSKRHEPTGDYTLSSFSSASPQIDVVQGLSDEAADVCTTWFNKYAVLPSDRHIDSLSQLTGESADAIRQWFGRLLKQGMGGADSAYKSQTDMMPALCWSDSYTTDLVPTQQAGGIQVPHQTPTLQLTQENTVTPERRSSNDTTIAGQPASTLRGGKKRCTPTEDRDSLARDPNKVYQCTRKCGKRYGRKCDWKRNEEEGYPCKSWVCSLCTSEGVENVRPCFRKYHFVQHFRNIHPDVDSDEYEQASVVCSETEFPRSCGFCKHRFDSRQDRIDHIADHFKQGKCMLDWNDESNEDADSSDNNDGDDNDDDNDKPSGDGYDGATSHPPPQSDPGDFGPHYYGGGDYAGGGSGGGSGPNLLPDSFFQFQLSSKLDVIDVTKQNRGEQRQQRTPSSPRTEGQSSSSEPDSTEDGALRGKQATPARDDQTSLAGDALSGRLVGGAEVPSQPLVARGVCLGKDGIGLIAGATNRLPPVLDSRTDPAGRNTKNSPTEALTHHRGEKSRVLAPAVLDAAQRIDGHYADALVSQATPAKALVPSTAVLDTIQHFTPQSFLSVRLLGAGGFSTVDEVLHRATNLRLGRKTLKNRNQTAIEELKKEVSVLQKLRHPHVIRFLGAYSKGDKMSILVSPIAETTLALWLEQAILQQPAGLVNTISKMFGCLVSSVRYLHEQRPVVKHMDIKPQNILIAHGNQEFPHVVLCDFGISSSDDDDHSDGQHKPLTRRYVAPEVFNGFTRKQAADVWSLGCVFAEMTSATFGHSNAKWLSFRHEYSGRTGKHYWQDVPSLQEWLSSFLIDAATPAEQQMVGALKAMLNADPNERPSAALLSTSFTPAPCCLEWPNEKIAFLAPDQELEAVEALISKDGIDCCDHRDQIDSVVIDGPPDLFKNAKRWIAECSHTHDACRQCSSTDGTLPTRLVDIQSEGIDDSTIRIVESASLAQGSEAVQYATLSYVWSKTDVTLTSSQLQNRSGLQRQTLPEALEAGIKAAQSLGYRYIWIDSLCILQDSEEDKRTQCAMMASVYRNAALTIVLDEINKHRSENVGIVLPSDSANAQLQTATGIIDRPSAISSLPVSDFVTPAFGWDTRAWALQERLLSRRLLHLCERQLYWECSSLKASDTFPHGLSSLVWEKAHSKFHHDRPQRGKAGSKSIIVKNIGDMLHSGKSGSESITDTLDKQTPLEATRLRNCQWIHKEGDHSGDSTDIAHTILQPADAKAPLSSKSARPMLARKNSSVDVAPSTKSAVAATPDADAIVGTYNVSGPLTGTPAHDDRTSLDRSASPYLKGLFGLSSLSDSQLLPLNFSSASKPVGPQSRPTDAHPALSKSKRGSETIERLHSQRLEKRVDLQRYSKHVHFADPKLQEHHLAARGNDNATLRTTSNRVGASAPPFWDSDHPSCKEHGGTTNVSVTERDAYHDIDSVPAFDIANVNAGLSKHPLSDSLANSLAHQLASCKHSHPCSAGAGGVGHNEILAEEDETKV